MQAMFLDLPHLFSVPSTKSGIQSPFITTIVQEKALRRVPVWCTQRLSYSIFPFKQSYIQVITLNLILTDPHKMQRALAGSQRTMTTRSHFVKMNTVKEP